MIGVNDLERKWREEAREAVPEEYTCRGLGEKYLRGDNSAAGLNDAADYLEDAAQEAWHPVSEPPTEDDYSGPPAPFAFQWILVRDGWGTWGPVTREQFEDVIHDPEIPEGAFYTHWARPEDVVLMPPQSTTGEGE